VKKVLRAAPVIDGHDDLLIHLFIHFFGCEDGPKDLADYPINVKTKG